MNLLIVLLVIGSSTVHVTEQRRRERTPLSEATQNLIRSVRDVLAAVDRIEDCITTPAPTPTPTTTSTWVYATAQVNPSATRPTSNVMGTVNFRQQVYNGVGGPTEYMVKITGFNNSDAQVKHGSHIHEFSTIRDGCEGSGHHYNPTNVEHGLPTIDLIRHLGDLGNVEEDSDGNVNEVVVNDLITLIGEFSIIGRTWDVHEFEDDGGQPGGNAGPRMACGVVGFSDGSAWQP